MSAVLECTTSPAMGGRAAMFSRLRWYDDRVLLDDLVFRIQHVANDRWELGDECFLFYKIKGLVDQYADFWAARDDVIQNVMEIGIWDGGSTAFWCELFCPSKHVAVDLSPKQDTAYFKRYLQSRGLQQKVKTCWGVDQADTARLLSIVQTEFREALDLVIDDASHLYAPTRSSFEALFTCLRPGGLYIIEDWAWDHWPEFHGQETVFAGQRRLTDLVCEVTEAIGTCGGLLKKMYVYPGFVAIERGDLPVRGRFDLQAHIVRRPLLPDNERTSR